MAQPMSKGYAHHSCVCFVVTNNGQDPGDEVFGETLLERMEVIDCDRAVHVCPWPGQPKRNDEVGASGLENFVTFFRRWSGLRIRKCCVSCERCSKRPQFVTTKLVDLDVAFWAGLSISNAGDQALLRVVGNIAG